jgi:hypothetical protein
MRCLIEKNRLPATQLNSTQTWVTWGHPAVSGRTHRRKRGWAQGSRSHGLEWAMSAANVVEWLWACCCVRGINLWARLICYPVLLRFGIKIYFNLYKTTTPWTTALMGEGFDLAPSRGVLHGKSMYDVSVDPMIFFHMASPCTFFYNYRNCCFLGLYWTWLVSARKSLLSFQN